MIAAWILPEVVIGFAWFAFLNYEHGTLNMILTAWPAGRRFPAAAALLGDRHLQHTARRRLLDDAVQLGLSSIPPSYFQAADVAGASSWQKFRDIGLPLIRGHIVTDLMLITMWTFNVFTPFILTGRRAVLPD